MILFWDEITGPLCAALNPRVIVEIGAEYGAQTRRVLEYARANQATAHIVDPFPQFDVDGWKREFGETFQFHRCLSLEVLPSLDNLELVLIDGDHNWYTVYHELKAIAASCRRCGVRFPVVLLHDICWPYARRDLYYDPQAVPAEFRQPYQRKGMKPGQSELAEKGGYNSDLCNAISEGGPKNGVLTAVEDFLAETGGSMEFVKIPAFHGAGLLFPKELMDSHREFAEFCTARSLNAPVRALLKKLEASRIDAFIDRCDVVAEREEAREAFFRLEREFDERTVWALKLDSECAELRERAQRAEKDSQECLRNFQKTRDAECAELREKLAKIQIDEREQRDLREECDFLEEELKELRRSFDAVNGALAERDQNIGVLTAIIQRVEAGPLWRARRFLRNVVPQPVRTGFGVALRKSFRGIEVARYVLRHEGGRAFVWKTLRRLFYSLPVIGPQVKERWDWSRLCLPQPETPAISIIIPVYNKHDYTFRCLESIARETTDVSYEVIVVDDCSKDCTPEMLRRIKGVRAVRNQKNLGFIGSCNAGAEAARGEYLLMLNNDTQVCSRWASELLETFHLRPNAGLVGAKLVYPDGRLQEAGGIVWRDGRAWNFGKLDDPRKPEFNYLRQADYCSGAGLMISRELFFAIGAFDRHFAPAYYEDVDLAFRVRQSGREVWYQPRSVVIHFEGISCGTDLAGGVKRYQIENQQKFFERWKEELADHGEYANHPELEKDRRITGRALVLDATMLTPDCDAGSLRMWNVLRLFQELGYAVTFMPSNLGAIEPGYSELQRNGIEVITTPFVTSPEAFLEERGATFDVVMVSRADVAARHLETVRRKCPRAKVLFDTVDLHYLREQRQADLEQTARLRVAARRRKRQELKLCQISDVTLVVSPVEKVMLEREGVAQVDILSLIQDLVPGIPGYEQRRDIIFLAGFNHPPNVDAVRFFVEQVWPSVAETLSGVKFYIVGANPPREVLDLANDQIVVTGYVEDLSSYLSDCRISIAPIRYGAGVKGKITSSLAYGLPVVCTTVAAEGMYLQNGVDAIIADEPGQFASSLIELYQSPDLWVRLSENGRQTLERHFSKATAKAALQRMLPHGNRERMYE